MERRQWNSNDGTTHATSFLGTPATHIVFQTNKGFEEAEAELRKKFGSLRLM